MKKTFFITIGFVIGLVAVFVIFKNNAWAGPILNVSSPSLAQAGACGETGAWNILVVGSDYAELRGQRGSDLTRMLRVDFDNNKVSSFSFPRALWVDAIGLGLTNPDINALPLGMVFYEGRKRSTQFAEIATIVDGTRFTARALSKNFSVSTDHYIAVDLNHLAEIIDNIGGLPINIPVSTTDPYIGVVIPAGQQTLSGAKTVAYARAIPDNDFGRIKRNDLIVMALLQKLLDPAVVQKIPDLYTQFKSVIATDLSLEQINHLACLFKDVPAGSITLDGVSQNWTSAGPQGSLSWNKSLILKRLKELGMIP